MSDHAKFAPSAAHRWMRCPGSVQLSKDVPDSSSEYAREGTAAHAFAAQLLRNGEQAATVIGQEFVVEEAGQSQAFTCDPEMAGYIQEYLNVVRSIEMLDDGALLIEQKVVTHGHVGYFGMVNQDGVPEPEVHGTADAIIWSGDSERLHVIDLKYGAGVLVPVVGNEQLRCYGLGSMRALGRDAKKLKEIHLHIVQPRREDGEGNTHRTEVISPRELERFAGRVAEKVIQAQQDGAELFPGDHCTFCPVAGICPALRAVALKAAQDVFPTGDPLEPVTPPHPSAFSTEQLAVLLRSADIVETWLSKVRENALERAMGGHAIPGYKLVSKIGHRKWTGGDSAVVQFLQSIGCDPWNKKLVTPAEAEKRIGKKAATVVGRMTNRPVTGVVLVPDSDKRPASDPGQAFLDSPLDPLVE